MEHIYYNTYVVHFCHCNFASFKVVYKFKYCNIPNYYWTVVFTNLLRIGTFMDLGLVFIHQTANDGRLVFSVPLMNPWKDGCLGYEILHHIQERVLCVCMNTESTRVNCHFRWSISGQKPFGFLYQE
jgi:hypothetical protein